jgi:hypothetical protein
MVETRTTSKELARLCARVTRWREREGGRGSRVPDALWQEAVEVAERAGLHATARATRFNYQRLKEQREGAAATERKARAAGNDVASVARERDTGEPVLGEGGKVGMNRRFVAVRMPAAPTASRTSIELVGRHGDQMRVEVAGDIDVIGLAQAFWGRPS